MLCCGLAAFLLAALAGSWRRLRRNPRPFLIGGGAMLLAIPAAVLAVTESPDGDGHARENVVRQAMRSICG